MHPRFMEFNIKLGQNHDLGRILPDLMWKESFYIDIKSPWNFGASYQVNDHFSLSGQYLHGSQVSVTGQVIINPNRPPFLE